MKPGARHWRAAAVGAFTWVVPVACSRSGGGTRQASSITVSACPVAEGATRRAAANLVLVMRTEPALTSNDEASVRVEGPDNYRTDAMVSVAGGSRLELPPGIYDVRVSLKGYDGVATRATLTGGCSAEMIATLHRR